MGGRSRRLTFALLTSVVFIAPAPAEQAIKGGELSVVVKGIRHATGTLYVSVCREAEFGSANCFRRAQRPVQGSPNERFAFLGVPAGTYAIHVIHDVNDNRSFDRDAYGAPAEPWGVSNNVRPDRRAPTFKEAAIKYDGTGMTLEVELR